MVIFNSITRFVEQVDRRRNFKRGKFDVLIAIFVGPTAIKDNFIPDYDAPSTAVGLPHPLMFVTDKTDVDKVALATEVTITFQGQIKSLSPPVVSFQEIETSGSYQVKGSVIVNPGVEQYRFVQGSNTGPGGFTEVPTGAIGQVVKVGTWTVNTRYLSKQAIIKYQAIGLPSTPRQLALAQPIAGYTILSEDRAPLSGQNQVDGVPAISLTVSFKFTLMCSTFTAEQVAAILYDCSETWEYKWIGSVNWGAT